MQMRRPPGVVMISPRIGAWLDRNKAIPPFTVGHRPATTGEIGIEWRIVLIDLVRIPPRGVGLPDFDQRVAYRASVLVEHAPGDEHALPQRSAGMLARQIAIGCIDGLV